MPKSSKKNKKPEMKSEQAEVIHPWRSCPLGQYPVREFERRVQISEKNPDGTTTVHFQCRHYPSHKDHLYKLDMKEVAEDFFGQLKGAPKSVGGKKGKWKYDGQDGFDELIRGWTQYWNQIFPSNDPLDPNLVKALIATESRFKPTTITKASPRDSARGLMQLLDSSRKFLAGEKNEIRDHFVDITRDEALDPNFNIAAGTRWLFRKKQVAGSVLGRKASWLEAVAAYKGYLGEKTAEGKREMKKIAEHYSELQK